jgi:uncharacterized protein DUF5309
MAATVAASKAYDLSGGALREDLGDIIYDISPMDAWFMSHAGRGTAKSTTHEWLTDSLTAASATNAEIEGDAFSATARTLPSRLKNYTQISRKQYEVTGTAQKVDNAGMRELLAYHRARGGKELKRDLESAMLGNSSASAGTSVSPRVSGGVPNWIYSDNHIKLSGQTVWSTTAPVSGFPTATIPGASTTAFTETDLKAMLQQAWSCGGDVDTILCPAAVYNTISGFTGLATRFRDVASKQQAQIIGAADVYVSAFGSHNIQLSRYILAASCYALQMDTWQVDYLRPFQTIPIAKIGDAEREMMLAEWTLRCNAPLANTKTHGIL